MVEVQGPLFPPGVVAVERLFRLYLTAGTADLDRAELSSLLAASMGVCDDPVRWSKEAHVRSLSSALITTHLVLAPFRQAANHSRLIEGFGLWGLHAAAACERYGISLNRARASFELGEHAMVQAAGALLKEATDSRFLMNDPRLESPICRFRMSLILGQLAAIDLFVCERDGAPWEHAEAVADLIQNFHRSLEVAGEVAVPWAWTVGTHMLKSGSGQPAQDLWQRITERVVRRCAPSAQRPFCDPYMDLDSTCLFELDLATDQIPSGPSPGVSYTLAPLLATFAACNLRILAKSVWPDATRILLSSSVPKEGWATFVWRTDRVRAQRAMAPLDSEWPKLRGWTRRRYPVPAFLKQRPEWGFLLPVIAPHRWRSKLALQTLRTLDLVS